MTAITAKELYELLPSVHRVRDAERGYPLQALIGIFANQADALAQDIDGLYANWFIETCAEWVVPYIGDLLRVRRLNVAAAGMSERSYVANTLGYRRRKGTVSVIERLAYDVTGWRSKAVETFKVLGTTQNINHLRPLNLRTPDLRNSSDLELVDGPFETAAHSVEVRRIEPRRGRYNIPDIAVMLWRLQAYLVTGATARPVSDPPDGRYTFNPLGLDEPLFNSPHTEAELGHLATEVDVPAPLRPRALHDDLANQPPQLYFVPGQEVLTVQKLNSKGGPAVPAGTVSICDLSNWQRPADGVAVDVARGRLTLPAGSVPSGVSVGYSYGFSADVGAGTYDRSSSVLSWLDGTQAWQVGVIQDNATRQGAPDATRVFDTLNNAIAEWNNQQAGTFGVICLMDSCTYSDPLPTVYVPGGSRLGIVAASSPGLVRSGATTAVEPKSLMPVIAGSLTVVGQQGAGGQAAGEVFLDGLLVIGQVSVSAGDLGRLSVASSTITDGVGVATKSGDGQRNDRLRVEMAGCLCGPVSVLGSIAAVSVKDSVVDGAGKVALDVATTDLTVVATTVFGTTAARTLNASDCMFTAPLQVERLQAGCVRFSYVPDGSAVPYAFRCQPATAVASVPSADAGAVAARLTPMFRSERLGDPGYAQLLLLCAPELLSGADNGAEMGVFNQVQQPHREANLRTALDEYLRFGLEAGIFYVN